MRLVVLAVVGLAAVAPSRADAALCRTKAGALVVRPACTSKRPPVDVTSLAAGTPKGDRGPAGVSSPRLRVFDAGGRFVGYLNAAGDVLFESGGKVLFAAADGGGFTPRGSLYFEASGCSGAPLVAAPVRPAARLVVHGTTGYFAGAPTAVHSFQSALFTTQAQYCTDPGSVYDINTNLCCSPITTPDQAGPAVAFDLSGFAPPFRLEVER
jgi:hypothetical protein